MSLVDALARIQQIQAELAPLNGGAATAPASAPAPVANAASMAGAPATGASFASALAQAQAPAPATGAGAVALPPRAAQEMTPGQRTFALQLAAQTGLDPGVVSAWMLAEESGGAAQARERQGDFNWLNIGWTDAGRYGTSGAVWSDPVAAANATAGWLKGQDTVAGYGRASAGIQAILQTAGQPPAAQIAALQRSGWASSGYPDLPGLYRQVAS